MESQCSTSFPSNGVNEFSEEVTLILRLKICKKKCLTLSTVSQSVSKVVCSKGLSRMNLGIAGRCTGGNPCVGFRDKQAEEDP